MFDDISPFDADAGNAPQRPTPVLQRTRGQARCTFKTRDGRTVLDALHQSGSFKVRLPRLDPGTQPEAVLLNTAGGLTDGDVIGFEGGLGEGASATFTTQAAERAYRAMGTGTARVDTRLHAAPGGHLRWLPQETILFDGARLQRTLDIDLTGDATLLAHESVIFGRTAMGEDVRRGHFADTWRVRRDGRLVHADALRVSGDVGDALARGASLAGARAMATVLYIGPDAEKKLSALRAVLGACKYDGVLIGTSSWSEKLVVRAAAADGLTLRHIMEAALVQLCDGDPLPRVWNI